MIISVFDREENIVEKEKLLIRAISPFFTMFSKGSFPRPVKRCHCVVMGQCDVSDCIMHHRDALTMKFL